MPSHKLYIELRGKPDVLIKIALLLFVSVPYLIPVHRQPIPSFYGEWWALLLGCLALLATTRFRPLKIVLPPVALIPVLLLLLSCMQWVVGQVPIREAFLIHGGYLLWGTLMLVLGASLTARMGTQWLFETLAKGLLFGALASGLLGLAQLLDIPLPGTVLFAWNQPSTHAGIFANLAQSNQLGSYIWMGISAAIYLHARDALSSRNASLAAIILGFVAGLTLSRMTLMYAVALLFIGLLARRSGLTTRNFIRERLIILALASLIVGGIVLHQWSSISHRVASVTLLDRYSPKSVGNDPRMDLWRDTLQIIRDHPWAGNGIGNYTWRILESTSGAPAGANTLPNAEHAHNLFLQIAADYGLPALLLCILIATQWLMQVRFVTPEKHSNQLGIDILVVLGIYSLLEYPLWYSYYLGLAALLLGALSTHGQALRFEGSQRLQQLGMVTAVLALIPLRLDYGALDFASNAPLAQPPTDTEWRQRIETVARIANHSSLGSYAGLVLTIISEPERRIAHDQSRLCEASMKIWPIPLIVTRCAALRALDGKPEAAEQLLTLLVKAYRTDNQRREIGTVLGQSETNNPEIQRLRVVWNRLLKH